MCVLYVSCWVLGKTQNLWVRCHESALFIVISRLLVYSAGSGVNRVQVVLSGFSKRFMEEACSSRSLQDNKTDSPSQVVY